MGNSWADGDRPGSLRAMKEARALIQEQAGTTTGSVKPALQGHAAELTAIVTRFESEPTTAVLDVLLQDARDKHMEPVLRHLRDGKPLAPVSKSR